MSVINLMLLGFLMEKPMNAYEVKKEVENRNLSWWIKGSSPSIYRNISRLNAEGYLDSEVVRTGEMPEKTVYTINEKGKQYFYELMEEYSLHPPQVFLDFTAVIANIGKVDRENGHKVIDNLKTAFEQKTHILKSVEASFQPYQAKSVIRLSEQMNELFCTWLQQFEKEYDEEDEQNAKYGANSDKAD